MPIKMGRMIVRLSKPAVVAAVALLASACATTTNSSTWVATQASDPITGQTRCTVSAPDRVFSSRYTRTGYLYPFVEANPDAGLLVGVTSGGSVRVTPGDILWRVDQNPHRTLRAADTPAIGEPQQYLNTDGMNAVQRQAVARSQAMTAGIMSSVTNGITATGGEDAEAMLAELRDGSGLLFRAATAGNAAGIPSAATYRVGMYSNGELTPIALDASFHAALAECGL